MTQTIGTYTIDIVPDSFREIRSAMAFGWDGWGTAGYTPQWKSYGKVVGWEFICKEDTNAYPWTSSVAYILQSYLSSGGSIALNVAIGTKHATPTNQAVYVQEIETWYEDGMNTRYFTLKLGAAN